jgi:hypothetical protein
MGVPRHKVQVDCLDADFPILVALRRLPVAWAERAIGEEMLQEEVEAPVYLGRGAITTAEGASVGGISRGFKDPERHVNVVNLLGQRWNTQPRRPDLTLLDEHHVQFVG